MKLIITNINNKIIIDGIADIAGFSGSIKYITDNVGYLDINKNKESCVLLMIEKLIDNGFGVRLTNDDFIKVTKDYLNFLWWHKPSEYEKLIKRKQKM